MRGGGLQLAGGRPPSSQHRLCQDTSCLPSQGVFLCLLCSPQSPHHNPRDTWAISEKGLDIKGTGTGWEDRTPSDQKGLFCLFCY